MFDIGFSELVLIGVVALLVIGPERLPETIRTASLWLNRIRRGFNEIKQEVQQELHNDAVMRDLRKTGEQLKQDANSIGLDLQNANKIGNTAATTVAANAAVASTVATTGTDAATNTETTAPNSPTTDHTSSPVPEKSQAEKQAE